MPRRRQPASRRPGRPVTVDTTTHRVRGPSCHRQMAHVRVTRHVTWPSEADKGDTRSTTRTMIKPGPGNPHKALTSPTGPPRVIRAAEGTSCRQGPRPSEARPITGKWLTDELALQVTRRVTYVTEARPVTGKRLTDELAAHVTRRVVTRSSADQGHQTRNPVDHIGRSRVRAGDRATPQRPSRDTPT